MDQDANAVVFRSEPAPALERDLHRLEMLECEPLTMTKKVRERTAAASHTASRVDPPDHLLAPLQSNERDRILVGEIQGPCSSRVPSELLLATRPPTTRTIQRKRRRRFRAVWISDVHLGTPGCKAAELLEFLSSIRTDKLYLVGDIIDGWSLARQHHWPIEHQRVLDRIFELAASGTEVIYVTGNHDEELRPLGDTSFGEVRCTDLALHTTLDGRRLVVLHGDQFDALTTKVRWLAELGDRAYSLTLAVNTAFNRVTARIGLREFSFSLYLKQTAKAVVGRVNRWDTGIAEEIARQGAHGLICGHVHKPEITNIAGALYLNDGDWVESCTTLVEHQNGALELYRWREGELHSLAQVAPRVEALELV